MRQPAEHVTLRREREEDDADDRSLLLADAERMEITICLEEARSILFGERQFTRH